MSSLREGFPWCCAQYVSQVLKFCISHHESWCRQPLGQPFVAHSLPIWKTPRSTRIDHNCCGCYHFLHHLPLLIMTHYISLVFYRHNSTPLSETWVKHITNQHEPSLTLKIRQASSPATITIISMKRHRPSLAMNHHPHQIIIVSLSCLSIASRTDPGPASSSASLTLATKLPPVAWAKFTSRDRWPRS